MNWGSSVTIGSSNPIPSPTRSATYTNFIPRRDATAWGGFNIPLHFTRIGTLSNAYYATFLRIRGYSSMVTRVFVMNSDIILTSLSAIVIGSGRYGLCCWSVSSMGNYLPLWYSLYLY